MFIYLAKKIKVANPDPVNLNAIDWNKEEGYIAMGGENGLLKVLQFEGADQGKMTSNLALNCSLEGHNGAVRVVAWNEQYRKLTTSDQYGLIIVWVHVKGNWHEEMINNRNKSVVSDMKWNSDGQKICIAYNDGAVIVGSVDGNRIWGDDLRDNEPLRLCQVEWSPDGRHILFATEKGDVYLYDARGNMLRRLDMRCLEGLSTRPRPISMHWYSGAHGFLALDCPALAICYDNGRIQIMRHLDDRDPVLIDAMMNVVAARWNYNGNVLAVAGTQRAEDRQVNAVQFYTPFGEHLRTLKVPGQSLTGIAWEGTALRLAMAVDHFIYFANVRPDYHWGYFGNTVVYAFTKPERQEHVVVFWDTKNNNRTIKYVRNLVKVAAAGDYCVLATRADDQSGQYALILCNANGTPVDSRYTEIQPSNLAMTPTVVAAASAECVYVWNFKTSKHVGDSKQKKNEKIFHVDDAPTGGKDTDPTRFKKGTLETKDPIGCICLSDSMLMVGRASGTLQQYAVPRCSLTRRHLLNCRPEHIALNCDSTRMSIIDINGVLTFFDVAAKSTNAKTGAVEHGVHLTDFERKDVWDMKWAADNPELFAMMERTYMYIFRNMDPEEPVASNGYICSFADLQLKSVLLDDIMRDPEHPTKDKLMEMESKSLRDTRALLDSVTIEDAYSFVEQNPHPRLWRLIAESALDKLDLEITNNSFVRCHDLAGVEFVRRLSALDDTRKQQAEVATYFQRFDEAESIYLGMDRRDLAINMRAKINDYFRVVQLIKGGHGASGDEGALKEAWKAIGDYYAERQHWEEAKQFYNKANCLKEQASCCYRLEDWRGLEELIYLLPEGDAMLEEIAQMFASVGLCKEAVAAYSKTDDVQASIDVCVQLNQWDLAVSLAHEHDVKEIDALLAKYASHLLQKGRVLEAIELYDKAKRHVDAAALLFKQAEAALAENKLQRAKRLYVLGGMQVERHTAARKQSADDQARSALDQLLEDDAANEAHVRVIETAWRGAEAVHLLLLVQRQLYAGDNQAAVRTAVNLMSYDDLLPPVQVYSCLALAALATQNYALCSSALIKLEALGDVPQSQRDQYSDLAMKIFTRHSPKDATEIERDPQLPISVVSGRSMKDLEYWICSRCRHRAAANEIMSKNFCPLCHEKI